MKTTLRTCTNIIRAKIAIAEFKLDLTKDFYELNPDEQNRLKQCYRVSSYNGRNNLGRSEHRQFWYHLQKGYELLTKNQ